METNENNNMAEEPVTEEKAGNDRDANGCIPSAGETWSVLQEACIKVFDVAQRLNPVVTAEGETVFSAFALFNDDQSKVEIFSPETESTAILDRGEDGIYQNDTYRYDAEATVL